MISITLPFESRNHSHNNGHWRVKAPLVRMMRQRAFTLAKTSGFKPIKGKHSISYRFYFPDNIRRDAANYIQSCKPYVDGIVSSGLIEGDHWQVSSIGTVTCSIDKDNPRIEIVIEGV